MDNYSVCGSDNATARLRPSNDAASYKKSLRIHNNTGQHITVTERNGMPIRVPTSAVRDGRIIIEVVYDLGLGVSIDPHGRYMRYAHDDAESKAYLGAMKLLNDEGLDLGLRDSSRRPKTFVIRHEITKEMFIEYGKDVYILELDVLVSLTKEDDHADHPYSKAPDRLDKIYGEVDPSAIDAFRHVMYIVSNNREVNAKYVNYNGLVYRIPSIVNHRLQDGLYVYGSTPIRRDIVPIQRQQRYDIEQAKEEFKLYDSVEDALVYGDESKRKDLELEEMRQATKLLDAELKHERLNHERELEAARREAAMEEEQRQRRMRDEKEHHEYRSHARKDTSEIVKMIPAILSGILSIAAIIIKIKS